MIIVDTSVWADHFRSGDPHLMVLWTQDAILQHPLVTGELAMGNLRDWAQTVAALQGLPQAEYLSPQQVLGFVEDQQLMGTGLGFIDAHILAATADMNGTRLWTRDKRLAAHAERLGIAHNPG